MRCLVKYAKRAFFLLCRLARFLMPPVQFMATKLQYPRSRANKCCKRKPRDDEQNIDQSPGASLQPCCSRHSWRHNRLGSLLPINTMDSESYWSDATMGVCADAVDATPSQGAGEPVHADPGQNEWEADSEGSMPQQPVCEPLPPSMPMFYRAPGVVEATRRRSGSARGRQSSGALTNALEVVRIAMYFSLCAFVC